MDRFRVHLFELYIKVYSTLMFLYTCHTDKNEVKRRTKKKKSKITFKLFLDSIFFTKTSKIHNVQLWFKNKSNFNTISWVLLLKSFKNLSFLNSKVHNISMLYFFEENMENYKEKGLTNTLNDFNIELNCRYIMYM